MQGMHNRLRIGASPSFFRWKWMLVLAFASLSFSLLFNTPTFPAYAFSQTTPTPQPPINLTTMVAHSMTGPQIPVGQSGSVTASCQSGEQLVSGGFTADALNTDRVVASYPSTANAWTATVNNTNASRWVQLTTIVYCLQASYSLATTIVHTTGSPGIASCPTGAALIGGGFQDLQGRGDKSFPSTTGWLASGTDVYAVCAGQNATLTSVAQSSISVPDAYGYTYGGFAGCPSGQFATSGGSQVLRGETAGIASNSAYSPSSWLVSAYQQGVMDTVLEIDATCVSFSSSVVTPTPSVTSTTIPSTVHMSYQVVSQWSGGFSVNIVLTNNGTAPINGWTLQWTFPGTQQITQLWNGIVTQSGNSVTVTNQSYNSIIPAGGSVYLGFNGSWSGSNPNPTAFTVNGVPTN